MTPIESNGDIILNKNYKKIICDLPASIAPMMKTKMILDSTTSKGATYHTTFGRLEEILKYFMAPFS
jgi:hypothetical protein